MSKMIFVNLSVRDPAASTAFYIALGGTLNPLRNRLGPTIQSTLLH
jgi:predicted lactoylglutathione lyase